MEADSPPEVLKNEQVFTIFFSNLEFDGKKGNLLFHEIFVLRSFK